ncbi:hypothetical protein AGMMS49940_13050 [Spirochaetia bacterium]|nr:hypothetical protein AGMMS49940_13050 [Spirochaetia bacterium]
MAAVLGISLDMAPVIAAVEAFKKLNRLPEPGEIEALVREALTVLNTAEDPDPVTPHGVAALAREALLDPR